MEEGGAGEPLKQFSDGLQGAYTLQTAAMAGAGPSLVEIPAWRVDLLFFVLLLATLALTKGDEALVHYLANRKKIGYLHIYEAVKEELLLVGVISLVLSGEPSLSFPPPSLLTDISKLPLPPSDTYAHPHRRPEAVGENLCLNSPNRRGFLLFP